MENFNDPKPDLLSSTGLQVDEQSGNHLKDAAQWAKAIAIIVSVIGAIATLAFLVFGSIFSSVLSFGIPGIAGVFFLVILIIAGVALIGIISLFRFSSGMSMGINNQDATAFDKGISGLKNYFILMGVLMLLYVIGAIVKLIASIGFLTAH